MSRALPLLLASLVVATGCGSKEPAPPPDAAPPASVTRADLSPLPDFHGYVVGELPPSPVDARDPFHGRPTTLVSEARASDGVPRTRTGAPPSLVGIVQRDGRLVALLGSEIAEVGDVVAGWRVRSVETRAVLLERDGRQVRLDL